MTDPKPAPPATDDCICEDVRVLGACPVHEPRSTEPANDDLVAAWLADLQGMDDADREHDVTVLDTRSLLLRIAADAETIKAERSRADRYEAESEQKGADLMAAEAVIESLKADAAQWDAIIKDNDATRTIRDLRETIRKQAEEIEAKEQEIRGLMFEKTPMLLTIDIANQELATARAQMETLREALIRLRDCDWVISLPDRMDAVRDIARAALAATEPKG